MPDVFRSDVEANDPEEIPAPDVDLSQAIYPSPESTPVRGLDYEDEEAEDGDNDYDVLTITDPGSDDTAHMLSDINLRLARIEKTVDGMKEGVNTIGVMMNSVAEAFDTIMQKVNEGGIGALLGGFMGGKKNG